jgi:hypothetical protein
MPGRYLMKSIILLSLLGSLAMAQTPAVGTEQGETCPSPSAALLARPVVLAMWGQDEVEYEQGTSSAIRIAVHPAWGEEVFADVPLNRNGEPVIVVLYSMPNGVKTVTELLEARLKEHPSTDPKSLAKTLPIKRTTLQPNKQIQKLIAEFFTLHWNPKPILIDQVRVDAPGYEVGYAGDNTMTFGTPDSESPFAKWIESFLSAVHDAAGK